VTAQTVAVGLVFGDGNALQWLRKRVASQELSREIRRDALDSLLDARDPELVKMLIALLDDVAMRDLALAGLANYDDASIPPTLLELYPRLSPEERRTALATLCARTPFALELLREVSNGSIPAADLPADLVRQLNHLGNEEINRLLADTWGQVRTTAEEKAKLIAEYRELVANPPSPPNAEHGRAVFARTCQQCHTLYGVGNAVGPDLTGSNRRDLEYLLTNIVDPSSVIAKDYMTTIVLTVDGRIVSGVLGGENDNTLTLKTATETIVVPHDDVESRELSETSVMPEDQLKQFTPREIVSLVAYLRSEAQVPLRATADNAASIFSGRDLVGWTGEEGLWSVENGEIVGRSPGLDHNSFLISDLAVEDFRLSLEVKLEPNDGNSGIQFRSRPIEHGEMRGYQADIGAGWWGKLYEENGRALLWDKSGEEFVKPGQWNRYDIEARGSRIRTWVNGKLCVDLDDAEGERRGVVALQIHSGGPMEVRFRNIKLDVLGAEPPATATSAK
jgi:putative heme-binding domain-containing protein